MLFDVLENVSMQYIRQYGKVQVLIIDGVNLLAKCEKDICSHLVTHAKVLANKKTLKLRSPSQNYYVVVHICMHLTHIHIH